MLDATVIIPSLLRVKPVGVAVVQVNDTVPVVTGSPSRVSLANTLLVVPPVAVLIVTVPSGVATILIGAAVVLTTFTVTVVTLLQPVSGAIPHKL